MRLAVNPFLLADIGEGIVECEVIQWFVEPGVRVEEFSPPYEVQSDKTSVEITSRFTGIVKRLHYEAGEMARVGKPFVDIDIEADAPDIDLEEHKVTPPAAPTPVVAAEVASDTSSREPEREASRGKMATLATPAVRHLSRELKVEICEINGSGKDGRVLKEDIYKFAAARGGLGIGLAASARSYCRCSPGSVELGADGCFDSCYEDSGVAHADAAGHVQGDDALAGDPTLPIHRRGGPDAADGSPDTPQSHPGAVEVDRLTYLPFIIKAMSMALEQSPLLNARVDVDARGRPELVMRQQHNVGVAMDTPQGLLVPAIRDVAARSIAAIAGELGRLQRLATTGRLGPDDLAGGTISVSNIGNIGGTCVSPIIVEREVAILGIGRIRDRPVFAADDDDRIIRRQVCNLSWSADHRVVDGATMARASEVMRRLVEEPDVMVMHLR